LAFGIWNLASRLMRVHKKRLTVTLSFIIARSRDSSFHSEQAPQSLEMTGLPRPDKSGLAMRWRILPEG
jgi:hypothetical protein